MKQQKIQLQKKEANKQLYILIAVICFFVLLLVVALVSISWNVQPDDDEKETELETPELTEGNGASEEQNSEDDGFGIILWIILGYLLWYFALKDI